MNNQEYFRRESAYVERNREAIRRVFGDGTFIAIYGEMIIDSDKNEFKLCARIESRRSLLQDIAEPVLIAEVYDPKEDIIPTHPPCMESPNTEEIFAR